MKPLPSTPRMHTLSRAQFLRGNWRDQEPRLRPPWALTEALFTQSCDGCGDCVDVCPRHILRLNRGYPVVDFSQGECTFCGDCTAACVPGALQRASGLSSENESRPWTYRAVISGHCLALNGTSCVCCVESCAREAIITRPALGGRLDIRIDTAACNACGACIAGCPVSALSLRA